MIRRVSLSNAYASLICQSNCVFVQTIWETFIVRIYFYLSLILTASQQSNCGPSFVG